MVRFSTRNFSSLFVPKFIIAVEFLDSLRYTWEEFLGQPFSAIGKIICSRATRKVRTSPGAVLSRSTAPQTCAAEVSMTKEMKSQFHSLKFKSGYIIELLENINMFMFGTKWIEIYFFNSFMYLSTDQVFPMKSDHPH